MRSVKSSAKSRIGLLNGSAAACARTRFRIETSVTASIVADALALSAVACVPALAIATYFAICVIGIDRAVAVTVGANRALNSPGAIFVKPAMCASDGSSRSRGSSRIM